MTRQIGTNLSDFTLASPTPTQAWRRAPACSLNPAAGPLASQQTPFLFIGILSSPKNWALRQAQRESWTSQELVRYPP
jgi:hypothetical protein